MQLETLQDTGCVSITWDPQDALLVQPGDPNMRDVWF